MEPNETVRQLALEFHLLPYSSRASCADAFSLVAWRRGIKLFPWYYHCKLGFLVWHQSQKGAEKLYRDYLRPLLLKNEKSVDAALNFLEKEVGTQVRAAETDIGKFAHYARDVKDALANFLNSRS